jgi:Ca2+/Na+ antiporter
MTILAIIVSLGVLVLFGIHARATNGAFQEMGLLKFLSYNRLTMLTMAAAVGFMLGNMATPLPIATSVVFVLLALLWLYRTLHAVNESKEATGKTNIQYTYQKMFNEMGQEIDADAIEAFIDGQMDDLNEEITQAENELSDEQRRLIDREFEDGQSSDEEGGQQPQSSDQGENEGESAGPGEGDVPSADDDYKFPQGTKVKVISIPKGVENASHVKGVEFIVGLRLPNIKMIHPQLEGHGYFVDGVMLPEECLTSV